MKKILYVKNENIFQTKNIKKEFVDNIKNIYRIL